MKPGEEVARRTLHEIPSGSCLQENYPQLYTRSIELVSLILVSVKKASACGPGELALQRRACIFAGTRVRVSLHLIIFTTVR